jgi:hypothetical protein
MPTRNIPPANAAWAQSRFGRLVKKPVGLKQGRAKPNVDFWVGQRVAYAATFATYERRPGDPIYRPLRIYALDPAASVRDGALSTVNVPYEPIMMGESGPRGAILEIVGETSGQNFAVDLDDKFLLMQQGRSQSPEDPRFRQQMVYAVCTTTYAAFRHALGRDVAWGFRHPGQSGAARLRIRPSVRDLENAYYDRNRGELCFGTFTAGGAVAGRNVPGGEISLCLSHDIVVHEMSHALLDGLRSHFLFPSNPDVLAFHEGFADVMAIFQRFTYRDVVLAAIRKSRGEISTSELLTNIGSQLAQATTLTSAVRSATSGARGTYESTLEPHSRGEILVAAVFDAFRTIYQRRTASLLRLATNGTGLLPPGEIPDVLAVELTDRACRLAAQFLTICIRAIDYCPPVDITFGEFLRAVISADADVVPNDEMAYREAWIEAFARARIYPPDVPSLSEGALLWSGPGRPLPPEPELSFSELQFDGDPGRVASGDEAIRQAVAFGQLAADEDYLAEFGLCKSDDPALDGDSVDLPVVESVRSSRRVGPSGQIVFDLIAEITQRRVVRGRNDSKGFEFYGGATAVLDPKGSIRFVIRKSILNDKRIQRQGEFILKGHGKAYFGPGPQNMDLPESRLLLKLHTLTRPQNQHSAVSRQLLGSQDARQNVDRYYLRKDSTGPAVAFLRSCLQQALGFDIETDEPQKFDSATERAVSQFQCNARITVDGIVGPQTWTSLGEKLNYVIPAEPGRDGVGDWIIRLLTNDPATSDLTQLQAPSFLSMYEFSYGPLSQEQRSGLTQLLNSLTGDPAIRNVRWAAYMLATVKHECAETWLPIEEFGKGTGHSYGELVEVTDGFGNKRQNRYYGRGYVQLTWKENYQAMGHALGLGDQLMMTPERALDPNMAYNILSYGMRTGSFTGKKLSDYITGSRADFVNARRIINGLDQAQKIANYTLQMQTALLASLPGARQGTARSS